jgi:nucleoid DNA-binding protein
LKWFKHNAHSLREAAIERLIMEYGIDGYGLYYACMEMIAGNISMNNLTFELDHDVELIAHKFKMDTIRVGKIMHRCIELGLFQMAESGKIQCLVLAKMLDESISKNHYVKEMKKEIQAQLKNNSGNIPETLQSDKIRLDKIRLDKNKEEQAIDETCNIVSQMAKKEYSVEIKDFSLFLFNKLIDNNIRVIPKTGPNVKQWYEPLEKLLKKYDLTLDTLTDYIEYNFTRGQFSCIFHNINGLAKKIVQIETAYNRENKNKVGSAKVLTAEDVIKMYEEQK